MRSTSEAANGEILTDTDFDSPRPSRRHSNAAVGRAVHALTEDDLLRQSSLKAASSLVDPSRTSGRVVDRPRKASSLHDDSAFNGMDGLQPVTYRLSSLGLRMNADK